MSDIESEPHPHAIDIRGDDLHNHIESNKLLDVKHKELLDSKTLMQSKKPRKCVCVKDVKHKIIHK